MTERNSLLARNGLPGINKNFMLP